MQIYHIQLNNLSFKIKLDFNYDIYCLNIVSNYIKNSLKHNLNFVSSKTNPNSIMFGYEKNKQTHCP